MCCPWKNYHYARSDKYLGHRTVSQAIANYIAQSPILHHHPPHHSKYSSLPQKPLDLYISHVIHASKVPDIVPYTALYILASLSQPCQCRIPHTKSKSKYTLFLPSRFSHILSRMTTRTPLSRIAKPQWDERHCFMAKPQWDERHCFMGVFYLAILAFKPVFFEDHHKELSYQKMISICEIDEEEIGEVSTAFKRCIDNELQNTIHAMLSDKFVISVSEFDCPFAQKQLAKASEDVCETRQKRRLSLKESIGSFWKSEEKASSVAPDSKPQGSVDCGPNSASDESWCW